MSVLITGLYQMLQAGCMNFNLQQDFIYLMESIQKAVTPYEIHQVGQRSQVGNFHSLWRIYFMLSVWILKERTRERKYTENHSQKICLTSCIHHSLHPPCTTTVQVFNLQTFQLFYLPCIRFFIWKLLPWLLHLIPTHLTLLWGSNTLNIEKQMSKIMLIEQAPSWHPSRQDHEGALLHSPAPPLP